MSKKVRVLSKKEQNDPEVREALSYRENYNLRCTSQEPGSAHVFCSRSPGHAGMHAVWNTAGQKPNFPVRRWVN